ncbi:MAG: hypothetical protein Q7J10_02540 [Methanosarcinaceae archaeon]|nr:hypothetical protein [Methanosarcinaceae archaeon]
MVLPPPAPFIALFFVQSTNQKRAVALSELHNRTDLDTLSNTDPLLMTLEGAPNG